MRIPLAFPEEDRGRQGREARRDVDDDAARKVLDPHCPKPSAASPYPVGHRIINQRGPEERKDAECAELHPLGKRPPKSAPA